ncbi:hypothetical protein PMIN06_008601 [Paraphaeosphaeria minitans]
MSRHGTARHGTARHGTLRPSRPVYDFVFFFFSSSLTASLTAVASALKSISGQAAMRFVADLFAAVVRSICALDDADDVFHCCTTARGWVGSTRAHSEVRCRKAALRLDEALQEGWGRLGMR